MRNVIKSAGRDKVINNTHSDWYLEDHEIFRNDLAIFSQDTNNFINIFVGNFGIKHNDHNVVIKFYEKKKGGK